MGSCQSADCRSSSDKSDLISGEMGSTNQILTTARCQFVAHSTFRASDTDTTLNDIGRKSKLQIGRQLSLYHSAVLYSACKRRPIQTFQTFKRLQGGSGPAAAVAASKN